MSTRTASERKSIHAQANHLYTEMILPMDQGHSVVRELSKGVTGKVAEQFRKKANIDESSFSSIIGYSRMHYSRLVKDGSKQMRGSASNRLYRFAQILEHAIDLHNGDEVTALKWLKSPSVAFGDSTPLEMLSSEVGSDMVDALISQLELGILPA